MAYRQFAGWHIYHNFLCFLGQMDSSCRRVAGLYELAFLGVSLAAPSPHFRREQGMAS